ncbi:hypothetical protein C2869_05860 [Saccharobesus litoralis]|uniref:Outer membrane protein beta-barrel domain-containing protein n=1 Tax=Saccharobesus litoralis TaxID=2172099 RepID=A0A2S0VP45_9ALTE|nr:outer membrane beta-barrel protein [Saccharobesus litoralis]AWB65991.1 hypothetical protein C2869_05860 [Saccharobesus litoralis]
MKKQLLGIALSSLSLFSYAEMDIYAELLVGQSSYKLDSQMKQGNKDYNYSTSLDATSYGLRLGLDISEHFALEIAAHQHGSADLDYVLYASQVVTGPPDAFGNVDLIVLDPKFDVPYDTSMPIELQSVRLGVKGQWKITESMFFNGRLGIANWRFNNFIYQRPPDNSMALYHERSGADIYYSVGTDYYLTDNFYLGLEYSLLNVSENFNDHELFEGWELVDGSFEHAITDLSLVVGWNF